MKNALPLIFAGVLTLSVVVAACPTNQDLHWVDNTHGAPLLIIRNQHTVTLQNRTDKSVESYQLGCFRSDRLSIERRFALVRSEVPPSSPILIPNIQTTPDHLMTCQKLRTKLTVLEVTFVDGTTWRLSDSFSQSPNTANSSPNQNPDYIDTSLHAPLTLTARGMSLTIHNSSNATVQSYQLGCIRNQPHFHVLHRFPPQQSLLQPAAGALEAAFDSPPDEITKCQDLKAKLTVLRATFEGGTTWHLSDTSSTKK